MREYAKAEPVIPERWQSEIDQDGDTLLRKCCQELCAAEAKVAELESRVTELNDAIELRDQRINDHFAKVAEQEATIAALEAKRRAEDADIIEHAGAVTRSVIEKQASTIERLIAILGKYRAAHVFCIANPADRDDYLDHAPCEYCVDADAALSEQASR